MILIGRRIIVEFGEDHPQSRNALSAWGKAIKRTFYKNFIELKQTFPSVDYVYHQYTIFDISGNKYRLITEIDYSASIVNVKYIWTHAEYSKKRNEDAMRGGRL